MQIFKNKSFRHLKRIIGFIDTDPQSPTFGCADRYYWHYKLHDFPNARFQEACLAFAFAYNDSTHFLYKNAKLKNLLNAVIGFWLKARNRDGSVNEAYPREHSFCATAFGLFIITETMEILGQKEISEKYLARLEKTGAWLGANMKHEIANQATASAIGLYNLGAMQDNDQFKTEAKRRVKILLDGFRQNGYFSEYGGFDLGYNTITMSLLAQYFRKTRDEEVYKILLAADKKLSGYLDENGAYDQTGMSRNTEFIYPYSFKVTKSDILDKIAKGVEQDVILNPDGLDDRYVIGLVNDYLLTYYV